MMRRCDVLIVGGGPGGLAAACAAKKSGAETVILLERDSQAGGILNQCIHDGFGLIRYQQVLTGPEYADRAIKEAEDMGVEILTSRHVVKMSADRRVTSYSSEGIEEYDAKAVILATGCRERTRGNISIPGSRPAGVFTAGVAQNLMNLHNIMIGRRIVILGSGDIGLIMARRFTLEGAKVLAIAEIMPEPTGLARNVSQCVSEFGIPLYVRTTVSDIIGKRKLEAVELSDLDERGKIVPGSARRVECDALVLSVGLIPENEVAQTANIRLLSNHAVDTDKHLQTCIEGVFSCGNCRRVMDLADYVSEQGEMAGRNAVRFLKGDPMEVWDEEKSNCMKKGFPERDTITCTVCPNGCQIKWDENSRSYLGNACPRGMVFAEQERSDPKRNVTTTVPVKGERQSLRPVRTKTPVSRDEVLQLAEKLRTISILPSVKSGETVFTYRSRAGEDISVITTAGQ